MPVAELEEAETKEVAEDGGKLACLTKKNSANEQWTWQYQGETTGPRSGPVREQCRLYSDWAENCDPEAYADLRDKKGRMRSGKAKKDGTTGYSAKYGSLYNGKPVMCFPNKSGLAAGRKAVDARNKGKNGASHTIKDIEYIVDNAHGIEERKTVGPDMQLDHISPFSSPGVIDQDLSGCDLSGSDISASFFLRCNFDNSNLKDVKYIGDEIFHQSTFIGAKNIDPKLKSIIKATGGILTKRQLSDYEKKQKEAGSLRRIYGSLRREAVQLEIKREEMDNEIDELNGKIDELDRKSDELDRKIDELDPKWPWVRAAKASF